MNTIGCGKFVISAGLFSIKINGIKLPKELIRRPLGIGITENDYDNMIEIYIGKNKILIDTEAETFILNNVDITEYMQLHKNDKIKKSLNERIGDWADRLVEKHEKKADKLHQEAENDLPDEKIAQFEKKYIKSASNKDNEQGL